MDRRQEERSLGTGGPQADPSGHQVSLISTAYGELALQDAAQLFSRWSQENFLHYMMQHYAIDLLNEYRTEEIPGAQAAGGQPPVAGTGSPETIGQVQADSPPSPLRRVDVAPAI